MQADQLAVCVAINDNDRAWYEMLVPFILSLRQTDFPGHIAVIGFGLSQKKIDILRGQSVNVIVAEEEALPFGRYIEVGRLCEMNPGLAKVALYDADIWFCSEEFDLFSHVEGDAIFVCKDAYLCDFVSDPLIGPDRENNRRLVADEVVRRYGSALQAGLLAGTADAWRDFAGHVRDCVARIGIDFNRTYGTDTTFLHLWGAQGRVSLLPETQNFVVKDGVIERRDGHGFPILLSSGGPIRGLHMTTDIRFLNCWRYYSIHFKRALESGQPFVLADGDGWEERAVPPDLVPLAAEAGLEIVSIAGEEKATWHAFHNADGLNIVAVGNHELKFRVTRAMQSLVLNVMHLSGFPAPIKAWVNVGGQEVGITKDLSQWVSTRVSPGIETTLRAESLVGQLTKIVWVIADSHYLAQ